jgi:hypothetical protein
MLQAANRQTQIHYAAMAISRFKYKALPAVFRFSGAAEEEMQMQIARLCVLYEDLQLDTQGALAERASQLDDNSHYYRVFYFVRRTLATLYEIERGIKNLDKNGAFKKILKSWSNGEQKEWKIAVKFFQGANSQFLHAFRNDVGGHFDEAAASYAIRHLEPHDIASIELFSKGPNHADVRFWFARALVGHAMMRQMSPEQAPTTNGPADAPTKPGKGQPGSHGEFADQYAFLEFAFTFIHDAQREARRAIHTLAAAYIWDRFYPSGV